MSLAIRRTSDTDGIARSPVVDLAICLSAYAAMAHAVAVPRHVDSWAVAGAFFAGLALAQGVLSISLVRDRLSPAMVGLALWGNVAVICVYVVSRTAGLPFAPRTSAHGGRVVSGQSILPRGPESIGPLDVSTLVAELVLVAVLLSLMDRDHRRRTTTGLMLVGAIFWVAVSTGALS